MVDLNPETIAAAALALADAEGASAFSMRAVARALEVTPMALYHHVRDKEALAALVVDRALSELPLPELNEADWEADLLALARWMRTSMHAHPIVIRLRHEHSIWTPAVLAVGERLLGAWQRSGLPPDAVMRAALASSTALIGVIQEETYLESFSPPAEEAVEDMPDLGETLAIKRDSEGEFDLVVRAVVDGLYRQLSLAADD